MDDKTIDVSKWPETWCECCGWSGELSARVEDGFCRRCPHCGVVLDWVRPDEDVGTVVGLSDADLAEFAQRNMGVA